jgi:hypothetical protein
MSRPLPSIRNSSCACLLSCRKGARYGGYDPSRPLRDRGIDTIDPVREAHIVHPTPRRSAHQWTRRLSILVEPCRDLKERPRCIARRPTPASQNINTPVPGTLTHTARRPLPRYSSDITVLQNCGTHGFSHAHTARPRASAAAADSGPSADGHTDRNEPGSSTYEQSTGQLSAFSSLPQAPSPQQPCLQPGPRQPQSSGQVVQDSPTALPPQTLSPQ